MDPITTLMELTGRVGWSAYLAKPHFTLSRSLGHTVAQLSAIHCSAIGVLHQDAPPSLDANGVDVKAEEVRAFTREIEANRGQMERALVELHELFSGDGSSGGSDGSGSGESPNANIVDRDIATLIAEYTQLMSEMDAQMAQLDQHVDAQALAASMRVELDGQRQKSSPSASVGR